MEQSQSRFFCMVPKSPGNGISKAQFFLFSLLNTFYATAVTVGSCFACMPCCIMSSCDRQYPAAQVKISPPPPKENKTRSAATDGTCNTVYLLHIMENTEIGQLNLSRCFVMARNAGHAPALCSGYLRGTQFN